MMLGGAGCTTECRGAACGDLYTAADLQVSTGLDPEPVLTLAGSNEMGRDWSVKLAGDRLWVGQPDLAALALWNVEGQQVDSLYNADVDNFGDALALLDGWGVVGAPRHTTVVDGTESGALYFYKNMETMDQFPESFDRRIVGQVGERLGAGLATCGDLDQDGTADLLVRSEWADVGGQLSGALSLLSSSQFESAQRSDLRLLDGLSLADGGALGKGMVCDQALGSLDQMPEVIAGAPFASNGLVSGAGRLLIWSNGAGQPFHLFGEKESDYFGYSVAVGDLDGNGKADLAVGAPGVDAVGQDGVAVSGMGGAVYVYLDERIAGSVETGFVGLDIRPSFVLAPKYAALGGCEDPTAEEEDLCDNALLARVGASVAMADLDGNGRLELLVGAPGFRNEGKVEAGKLWFLKDNPSFWSVSDIPLPSSTSTVDLDQVATNTRLGSAFQQVGAVLTTGLLGSQPAVGLVVRKRASD